MSALPPGAPAWAWPLYPFGFEEVYPCYDAVALRPFPVNGNLLLSSDVTFTPAARIKLGRHFGVIDCFKILDPYLSGTRIIKGFGRHYYLPTAEDVALVRRLCPDLEDPADPYWLDIESRLLKKRHTYLAMLTSPQLLALLAETETPPATNTVPTSAGPSPAAPFPPAGTRQGEGGKPKPATKPDGPFDADGFRFAGVDVRFGKASKQYRLVMALWDAKKKRPAEPRPVQDVITQVWGNDNDTEDAAFRKLCSDVRDRFQRTNCPLEVVYTNGMVQLKAL
jgi:hypothetical protein